MEDCIFCKIVAGQVPSSMVAENELAVVFENINPVAEHHVLICPRKHVANVLDLNSKDGNLLAGMTALAQQVIKDRSIESGYKLLFNGGKYQAVPHLHWHLLGGKLEPDLLDRT